MEAGPHPCLSPPPQLSSFIKAMSHTAMDSPGFEDEKHKYETSHVDRITQAPMVNYGDGSTAQTTGAQTKNVFNVCDLSAT